MKTIKYILGGIVALGFILSGYFSYKVINNIGNNTSNCDSIAVEASQYKAMYASISEKNSLLIKQVDSLEIKLAQKPKIVIKYINKPVLIKVPCDSNDAAIDALNKRIKDLEAREYPTQLLVLHDTLLVADSSLIPELEPTQYGGEGFILGKNNETTVKIRKRFIKEGETLYLMNGENFDNYLDIFYSKKNIKRKLRYNTSSVYSMLVSTDENIAVRFDKVIKNKNKF